MTPVEQIKNKLSINDVVGSYIKVERAGANFKARCPFHNEKTPSFFISPERGSYYCFGCGAKGDIFSFVQQFEGLDFVGALRVLADRAGVTLHRRDAGVESRERSAREKLYVAHEYATLFYQRQLANRSEALEYLKKRGLTEATIKEWRLGYAPVEWRTLYDYLKSKNFSDAEIEMAGFAKKSEKSAGFYDRFRGRVMFPIFDAAGRVIAFSGRQHESDGTEAKYLNSPETPLFQKSHVLYGWHKARLSIRQKGQVVLVEGQMDLLACHQAGLVNTVATSGTALTIDHITLMKRLADKLVICYDADTAGQNAAAKGFGLALAAGLEVTVATLPAGKDPAELASESPEKLVTFINAARHILDVELERILVEHPSVRERDRAIEKTLLPLIALLESPTNQSRYVTEIAHKASLKEQVLWDEIKKLASRNVVQRSAGSAAPMGGTASSHSSHLTKRLEVVERLLWGLVFLLDNNTGKEGKSGASLDIRQKISTIVGTPQFVAREQAAAKIKDELLFEAEAAFASGDESSSFKKVGDELVADFEEEWLREELASATRAGQSQDVLNQLLMRLRSAHQKHLQ